MWRIFLLIPFLYNSVCEGVEMKAEFYSAVCTYVNCCCFTLSQEQFEEILDENVRLFHQTNEDSPFIAQGREKVSELFRKYVFENSSDIALKELNIKMQDNDEKGISLKMLVEETKITDDMAKIRFLFEECTDFQFSDLKPHKVISIHMHVRRQPFQ